jgi:DNA recombination protein RmuC
MPIELVALGLLALCILLGVLLLARRGDTPAALQTLEAVSHSLGQLQAEVGGVVRAQGELRREVYAGREASLKQIADEALGIRGELGAAHRALAEVKALEQGRARQAEQAADSLRRLEAVVAGSGSRGVAGENILARALTQLPPDLLQCNVAFGNKIVEYALRLPGGRFMPIDSKWTSVPALERLDTVQDPHERKKLHEQVARDLRARIRDMTKYLDPERTLSVGLLAVPDAVYGVAAEVHGEGYREGVVVVPYSLALPYVLAFYRLVIRFSANVDTDQLAARLRALDEALNRLGEEVEGRLSRGLVQIQNARDALRGYVVDAQGAASRLLRAASPQVETSASDAVLAESLDESRVS